MSHRCPVCKTPLWQGPFLRRLRCPRCGAEFRPTVPWFYFQFLVILFVSVCLGLILAFTQYNLWLVVLVLIIVALLFWFLPRLIRLIIIPGDLSIADGPGSGDNLQLELYPEWNNQERVGGGLPPLFYPILILAVVFFALILFRILR